MRLRTAVFSALTSVALAVVVACGASVGGTAQVDPNAGTLLQTSASGPRSFPSVTDESSSNTRSTDDDRSTDAFPTDLSGFPTDLPELTALSDLTNLTDLGQLTDIPELSELSQLTELTELTELSDLTDLTDIPGLNDGCLSGGGAYITLSFAFLQPYTSNDPFDATEPLSALQTIQQYTPPELNPDLATLGAALQAANGKSGQDAITVLEATDVTNALDDLSNWLDQVCG